MVHCNQCQTDDVQVLRKMKIWHCYILWVAGNVNVFTLIIFICTSWSSAVGKVGLYQTRAWQSFKINELYKLFVSGSHFKKWDSKCLLNTAYSSFIVDLPDDFLHPSRPWMKIDNFFTIQFMCVIKTIICERAPLNRVWFTGRLCNFDSPIAPMHDYVRRVNFTNKPRLWTKFFAFALFVRGYSFQLYCLGNSFLWNFAYF